MIGCGGGRAGFAKIHERDPLMDTDTDSAS